MRITPEQLEQMRTHEVADLLSNLVMALRRLPDVPWKELQQQPTTEPALVAIRSVETNTVKRTKKDRATAKTEHAPTVTSSRNGDPFSEAGLRVKRVDELKHIAADLKLTGISKANKEELIQKILDRQARGHSEQFAIQNM